MARFLGFTPALLLILTIMLSAAPPARANANLITLKLSSLLTSDEGAGVLISPDGSRVVYSVFSVVDMLVRQEIFSAPIGGGEVVRLNADLPPAGEASRFQISPDGGRVVYRADQAANNRDELFSVPITGGEPIRLHAPLAADRTVGAFAISPTSGAVVYAADQATDEAYEVFTTFEVPPLVTIAGPPEAPPSGDVEATLSLSAAKILGGA